MGCTSSPGANHDNIFVDVRPGQRFTYQYRLPVDQDPGTFWYHPHRHMHVRPQIYDGLAGAIVVEGGLDNLLPNIPQRLMVIQGVELCGPNGRSVPFSHSGTEVCKQPNQVVPPPQSFQRYRALFVNGVLNPTVKIRPGEIQRWRIVNATDNRILKLNLQGQPFEVLAEDGNTLPWMRSSKALLIGPGSRREVLVRGGRPGRYPMRALFFRQFASSADGPTPNQSVLTLVSLRPQGSRSPARPGAQPSDGPTSQARGPPPSDRVHPDGDADEVRVLHQREAVRSQVHRCDDEAELGRRVDAREQECRVAHLSHPHQPVSRSSASTVGACPMSTIRTTS